MNNERQEPVVAKKITGEFIKDVYAGLRDEDLMTKYGLPRAAFYHHKAAVKDYLAREKSASEKHKLRINARQFLHNVRAHMDDQALMEKYHINQRQLQSLLRQLIQAGLMSALELANRLKVTRSQVTEAFAEMGKAIRELD
jgi:hypothetical protein